MLSRTIAQFKIQDSRSKIIHPPRIAPGKPWLQSLTCTKNKRNWTGVESDWMANLTFTKFEKLPPIPLPHTHKARRRGRCLAAFCVCYGIDPAAPASERRNSSIMRVISCSCCVKKSSAARSSLVVHGWSGLALLITPPGPVQK
jgi:hypothetical protein